jgi:cellulose biosynthesis protein BcsQ
MSSQLQRKTGALGGMMGATRIIAITINKRGVGKTIIARSLATAAASAGLAVLILDMDTQQNSTSWRRRRPEEKQLRSSSSPPRMISRKRSSARGPLPAIS